MKSALKILFPLLLVQAFLTGPVAAQHQPPGVIPPPQQNAYAQLQEQVNFLLSVSKEFPDPQLLGLLKQIDLHMAAAKQAAQAGKPRRATQELRIAQKLADQAMKLVVTGPVSRLQEQLDERIRQAEQAIHMHFNPEAQRLLQQAKANRKKAQRAYWAQQIQKAMELYRMAMYQAEKALEFIVGPGGSGVLAALNEEKANYHELHRRAQHLLSAAGGSSMARELFRQAVQQQRRAEEALSRGNTQQAMELYRWASRLLIRAIDMMGTNELGWKQRANEEIMRTQELLRSVERAIDRTHNPQSRRLLDQAARIFLDARKALSQKDYPGAVKKAELARRLLNRIGELQSRTAGRSPGRLRQELQILKDLIATLRSDKRLGTRPDVEKILDLAQRYIRLSERDLQAGNLPFAEAELLVATRMAGMARQLLNRQGSQGSPRKDAERMIADLQSRLESVGPLLSGTQEQHLQSWFNSASEMLRLARQSLEAGRPLAAQSYARLGLELLQQIKARLNRN